MAAEEAQLASVFNARVVTVSTRAAAGKYEDTAGPTAANALVKLGLAVDPVTVVADGEPVGVELAKAVASDISLVVTCGGTGLGPTDLTPEQTVAVIDRPVPGISDYLRAQAWDQFPHTALSRAVSGIADRTLIINLPGSRKAVEESCQALAPILIHALEQIAGGDHERVD